MYPYLVADIGGTNARFAIVKSKLGGQYQLEHITKLNGSDYSSFFDALKAYLEGVGIDCPKSACIAIAGPIDGDVIKMTNLPWQFSRRELQQAFALEKLELINDFAAMALCTSELDVEHVINIKPGTEKTGNKAILGPGTGLGVAGLARSGNKWLAIPSEGGHVNVAPATPLECDIIKAASASHGHVSAETFISGPGIVNLYRALAQVRGEAATYSEPQQISAGALERQEVLSVETLKVFCSFLGTLSGNLALTYGALGGVYLAGGILPRFIDFFQASEFVQRFSEKGVMSPYLSDIPVNLITYEFSAFLGAAACLDHGE